MNKPAREAKRPFDPERETPGHYSKRTGTNFIYLEIWTDKGNRLMLSIPGCASAALSSVLTPALDIVGREGPPEKYQGGIPYQRRDR